MLVARDVAARAGVQPGDPLTLSLGPRRVTATVAGLLAPADDLGRRALDGLILADIATAQEVLDRVGRLDRIDLLAPTGDAASAAFLAPIRAILPPAPRSSPPARRGRAWRR